MAFISLAEETGLILPIGQWVLEEACRRVKLWNEQRPADSQVTVSVNVSARQFQSPDMVEVVARTLRETGLDGRNLKLELTESVLMEAGEATIAKLTALKQLGVKLAIDDFGTGYSSLAYLRRFPLDVLKIDRSFTSGLGKTSEDTTIVQAIVSMAKSLNLAVAGEGIETAEQLGYLRALRCDLGQGYYFSRPVPAEEIPAVLSRGAAPVPSHDQITPWSAPASI